MKQKGQPLAASMLLLQQTAAQRVNWWCSAAHLGLSGCPIFICATDVDAVVTPAVAEAGVAVGAEHAADDVAQVGHIVHIGQGAGDHHVALPCTSTADRWSARLMLPTVRHMTDMLQGAWSRLHCAGQQAQSAVDWYP